jgi:FkbM family methyltransferase
MKIHLSKKQYVHRVTGLQYPFHYRPGTSDEKCMVEVLDTECYAHDGLGFRPRPGEHWLDLGANVGAFSFWCMLHGAHTTAYEPDPLNYRILNHNAAYAAQSEIRPYNSAVTVFQRPKVVFYTGALPGDFYRNTCLAPATIREMHEYNNTHVSKLKGPYDGIKMDIEGSEFPIIDMGLIPPCNKLVIEYHLSHDPDMSHFRKRIKLLKKRFRTVYYIPSMDQEYPNDKYPGKFDRYVWCMDAK